MKTIYLCGPINGCTDAEANDWRELVKVRAPYFEYLNPMRRDYRGKEAESVNEIVTLDKIDIANSDALLVNYDKPSVVVCRPDAVIGPWLRYHSHKITHSFDDAIIAITDILA
jgi:hypothetical protein